MPEEEIRQETRIEHGKTLAYLAPNPEFTRKITRHYRGTLIIGPMGFGKTSLIEAKLGEAVKLLTDTMGVDEREILVVYGQEQPLSRIIQALKESEYEPGRLRYLYLFVDDALSAPGQHGRRASSRENVQEGQLLAMIRHRFKEWGYDGYAHVVYAAQVYTGVDITIRRVSKLKVWKDLPDERSDWKIVAWMLGSAGLSYLAKLTDKLTAPRTPWEFLTAIYTGVARLGAKRWIMRAYPLEAANTPRVEDEARKRREWLARAQRLELEVGSEDAERGDADGSNISSSEVDCEALYYVVKRLWEHAELESRGADMLIEFPRGARIWMRKSILEATGLLGG